MRFILAMLFALNASCVLAGDKKWEFGDDDPQGFTAYVSAGKDYFGYRCFNNPDDSWLGNTAYFFRFYGHGGKCLSPALANVIVTGNNSTHVFKFNCKSEGNDALYFELAEDSRVGLHNIQEMDELISKEKSGYVYVTVTDTTHFGMRFATANSKIRDKIPKACKSHR